MARRLTKLAALSTVLCWTALAHAADPAKSDWRYKSFPRLPAEKKLGRDTPILTKHLSLFPIRKKGAATHQQWYVDQVYLSVDNKKRVFVKKQVVVEGKNLIGGWRKAGRGFVYHKPDGKTATAYFAEGFSAKDLLEFEGYLRAKRKVSAGIWSAICPAAHAETTQGGGQYTWDGVATDDYCASPMVAAGSPGCENSNGPVFAAGPSSPINPQLACAGSFLEGVWQGTGGAVVGAAQYVWTWFTDPAKAWDQTSHAVQEAIRFVSNIQKNVMDAIDGFANLPEEIRNELLCTLFGQLAGGIASGVSSVILAKFLGRVIPMMGVLSKLAQLPGKAMLFAGDKFKDFLRKLVRGEVPDKLMEELKLYDEAGMNQLMGNVISCGMGAGVGQNDSWPSWLRSLVFAPRAVAGTTFTMSDECRELAQLTDQYIRNPKDFISQAARWQSQHHGEMKVPGQYTWEQARNLAVDNPVYRQIFKGYGNHTDGGGKPFMANMQGSLFYGKNVGRTFDVLDSEGHRVGIYQWRADYKPGEGMHINVEFQKMTGAAADNAGSRDLSYKIDVLCKDPPPAHICTEAEALALVRNFN